MANKIQTNARETSLTLDMSGEEVASSLLTLTQHLMTFPPRNTSTNYNIGIGILFDSIRQSLGITDEGSTWETGVI